MSGISTISVASLRRGAQHAAGLKQPPPLSLYIHLPWCLRKCPYCDFNSHELRDGHLDASLQSRYLDALRADLEASLPLVWGRSVQSIFIGGGTPSLFTPEAIDQLLGDVRMRLRVVPDAEVTLEANPGTFERARFRGFRDAGVNRLSLGIQSFDDQALVALGRVHDRAQALAAAQAAREDFPTFNLDLMYALPGQTEESLQADLRQALAFEPPHLSCYHLTMEPNTLFASRPPPGLPDEDSAALMHDRVRETAQQAGLAQYEVSAFARQGHRCRHNLNYWSFGDYLGIGAGAHGKLSFHDRIVRHARFRHPQRYLDAALAGSAVEEERVLRAAELPFEFMLNALRLVEGVPARLFEERTGLSAAVMAGVLQRSVERGLLDSDPGVFRPTEQGLNFLSDLQGLFLE
jgi:oxygen-independent coproporphyrinogen-3 oxidase